MAALATTSNKKECLAIRKVVGKFLLPIKFNATVNLLGNEILISPYTFHDVAEDQKNRFDGLQIILDLTTGLYEFSEYQAGPNADKLYIYGYYKTAAAAFKRMLKGPKAAPVQIW